MLNNRFFKKNFYNIYILKVLCFVFFLIERSLKVMLKMFKNYLNRGWDIYIGDRD